MRSLRLLIVLFCSLPSWCLSAGTPFLPLFSAGFIERESLTLEGVSVRPIVAAASLGIWMFQGIGAEVELATGLRDDSVNNLDFDITSQLSFNLRFESVPINGVAAYALFGVVRSEFDTVFTSVSGSMEGRGFRGFRGAFGLLLPVSRRWAVDAAFTHHEYDDNIGVNSFRVGARYTINDVEPRQRSGWLR